MSGKGVRPGRSSGENGEFVRKFQVTKMLLHVTLGRCWRGIYPVDFSGRACSFLTSEFNDMLIHGNGWIECNTVCLF